MKILVSGYYGFKNTGDEAVLEALIKEIKSRFSQSEITVLSANPKQTAKTFQVEAVRRNKILSILKEISRADILISGGGGLLQNSTSFLSLFYYLGLLWLAKLWRKKAVVFAQGFGPISGGFSRWLTRKVLDRVDLVTLRDAASLTAVRELGVTNPAVVETADIALLLPPLNKEESLRIVRSEGIKREHLTLGVCVRPLSKKKKDKNFEKTMSQVLDYLIEKYHVEVVFFPFHYPHDIEEARRIMRCMHNSAISIFNNYSPREIMGLLGQMDIVIGMRLHTLVFAAASSVPMVGLSYDPKVAAFSLAVEQPFIPLEDLDNEALISKVEYLLEGKKKFPKILKANVADLKKKAKENFELLGKVCHG